MNIIVQVSFLIFFFKIKKKNKTEVKKTAIIKPKNFNQPSLVK
jgi:hypothetical protein